MPKPRAVGLLLVCHAMKPVGEPDAGDRHVRFDERGWETERWPKAASYRAHPRLYQNGLDRERLSRLFLRGKADTDRMSVKDIWKLDQLASVQHAR